tara:strand:+ start:3814 stop:7212 length:3399 start_codon:yes stop_codon:yes gene_type:complete
MDRNQAEQLIQQTFDYPFEEQKFGNFIEDLLIDVDFEESFGYTPPPQNIFKTHVKQYSKIGQYTDPNGDIVDVLSVKILNHLSLEKSRTMLRNFVANYLRINSNVDACMVAFSVDNYEDWRFSYIKLDYTIETDSETGRTRAVQQLTPAKRYSFLVGKNEPNHTAQTQLLPLLEKSNKPTLEEIEEQFKVDKVTDQFYADYRKLFEDLAEELERIVEKDDMIKSDFEKHSIAVDNFVKKLLGQIVFLYFLQKKGWLGITRGDDGKYGDWGTGKKDFMKRLYNKEYCKYDNFFNDVLEHLFYNGLGSYNNGDVFSKLNCKIPFLNGGLFSPINDYNWQETDIVIDDKFIKDILDTFDKYNFTVREDNPLDKEVAVDPEMLGRVFENLLPVKSRKDKGAFYTPRPIVHYMCQESLINYLVTECENIEEEKIRNLILDSTEVHNLSNSELDLIDTKIHDVKICDPAIGSGAFPVGMMNEIVKIRSKIHTSLNKEPNVYDFKKNCITNSLYGVDIDPSAIEVAKLRLWLSLIVDEDDYHNIKSLPNLDFRIMQGNSLIEDFHGISLTLNKEAEEGQQLLLSVDGSREYIEQLIQTIHDDQLKYLDCSDNNEKKLLKEKIIQIELEIFKLEIKNLMMDNPDKKALIEKEFKMMAYGEKIRNFFPWKLYFIDVFKNNGGFDIVIVNPPYLGEKGNKEIFRPIVRSNLGKYRQGKMDLFYYFFHLALDISKKYSQNAFITTNYYITASGGRMLRTELKNKATIIKLINFNELKIFKSALGQHNMITFFSNGRDDSKYALTSITKNVGVANESLLKKIFSKSDNNTFYQKVLQPSLYDGQENYIRFKEENETDNPITYILNKILLNTIPLGEIAEINKGFHSGCDKVTKSNQSKVKGTFNIGDGIFVLNQEEAKKHKLLDEEILHRCYKSSDINKWYTHINSWKKKYVIYTNKKTNIEQYPNSKKHLTFFRPFLEMKREYKNGRLPWYSQHWPRNEKIFQRKFKIVLPYRSKYNIFSIADYNFYASEDVLYINVFENMFSNYYILSLLNSSLFYQWLYNKGKRKGETLELYQKPLSEIPIRKLSIDNQKPFIKLVDQIIKIKKINHEADTSKLENEINQLVYKLYELTEEEIQIVESSIN